VTLYFPPFLGGLETYLERLAQALAARARVVVLAPRASGSAEVDAALGVEVLRRPFLGQWMIRHPRWFKLLYPVAGLALFLWTWGSLRRRRPRLVCSGSADLGWAVAAAALLLRADFTFICHGKDGHVNPGWFAYLTKRLPIVWMMRRARVCFANSRFTARLLDPEGRHGDKMRILPVPIRQNAVGVSEADLAEAARVTWGPAAGDPAARGEVILSVGRLREHKGFHHAIRAFARIAPEFPRARYVIVGAGPYEPELRALADEVGLSERIVFAGPRRPPDAFYALADVFVTVTWDVPAEPEGFGMVFLEAAVFGVPSIAGNLGGMTEAVIDGVTGYCVPGAAPDALAEALRRLLADPALRRSMGEAARAGARAFAPERVAETFLRECALAEPALAR